MRLKVVESIQKLRVIVKGFFLHSNEMQEGGDLVTLISFEVFDYTRNISPLSPFSVFDFPLKGQRYDRRAWKRTEKWRRLYN